MKRKLILLLVLLFGAFGAAYLSYKRSAQEAGAKHRWLESDSVAAIESRTRRDFTLTRQEFAQAAMEKYPWLTDEQIDSFIALKYIEARIINDTLRIHRKAVRNFGILCPKAGEHFSGRGATASQARISYVDSVLDYYAGENAVGNARRVKYRFSIDVPYAAAIQGDSLRVWMPLPVESDRQSDIEIIDASHPYIRSNGRSCHNSVYMLAQAPQPGDTAHFELTAVFTTSGKYCKEENILSNLKPYDKNSEEYNKYTSFDNRHIVSLDSLAHAIVGDETNPYRQSELVFDYIAKNYPWAGALEYSIIPCIPQYVVEQHHGDCGQVSLLYISLMRTLGIPARWESGWMLHPGELNLHDWAEVYFEGVGWLPVDVSFGRYSGSDKAEISGFYSHGIDSHRMAVNKAVGGDFYPKKKYIRSETVDFQVGEVETTRGNLFYPMWNYHMEILENQPIEILNK